MCGRGWSRAPPPKAGSGEEGHFHQAQTSILFSLELSKGARAAGSMEKAFPPPSPRPSPPPGATKFLQHLQPLGAATDQTANNNIALKQERSNLIHANSV